MKYSQCRSSKTAQQHLVHFHPGTNKTQDLVQTIQNRVDTVKVFLSLLAECGAPELDGSVQGRQRAAALQDPPETRKSSAERAGGAPAGPQEVLLHEVTSPAAFHHTTLFFSV